MGSICRLFTGALVGAALATTLTAAANEPARDTDEVVAVDGRDLDAYWRRSTVGHDLAELSGGDLGIYGCMAVPFVIRPDGGTELGFQPLLAKIGQARGEPIRKTDLYPVAVGALPEFQPVWDKPLSASIYTSHPVVIADAAIRSRLGVQQWSDLMDRLRQACDIQGLAGWVENNRGRVVEENLPASPEQFVR